MYFWYDADNDLITSKGHFESFPLFCQIMSETSSRSFSVRSIESHESRSENIHAKYLFYHNGDYAMIYNAPDVIAKRN